MSGGVDPKPRKQRFRLIKRVGRRLGDSVGTMRSVITEPRTAPGLLREGLLKLWRVRGGGFYGLGYVVTFVVLEIRMFVGNVVDSDDVVTMLVQEVLEILFRFAVQSFVNGFIAFGWPIFVVDYLGGWGLLAIGVGWFLFDRWAKPWINARILEPPPESART